MLIEKEVISPGTYWYVDEATGMPRKLVVTPEDTKYWHEQGSKMLSAGLVVPIPCEHDFKAHPMTPREKLLNNAGEIKEYRLKGNSLYAACDIQDEDVRKKIGGTIRWTSPWITSFTDGQGKKWDNVIAHLALTTRPRIVKQAPFQSIAAALSIATEVKVDSAPKEGICISKAGRLVERKKDKKICPQYPIAFSLISGGIKLAEDYEPLDDDGEERPKKKKPKKDFGGDSGSKGSKTSSGGDSGGGGDDNSGDDDSGEYEDRDDISGMMNPLQDQVGDVKMEELLCDLLTALGVQMPENVGETEFKRALYEAVMAKIKELTAKGQATGNANAAASGANTTSPAGAQNPLIQQEQQPMYMSLEEINKITDPTMKNIALSMYNENVKLRAEADANAKLTASLRDSKLKEENNKRQSRIAMLGKLSPKVKADLDTMVALPSMALSMGEGGVVVDPMEHVLAVLEKGLSDLPRLLTTNSADLSIHKQPTDSEMLSKEEEDKLADEFARMMGCPPERKTA